MRNMRKAGRDTVKRIFIFIIVHYMPISCKQTKEQDQYVQGLVSYGPDKTLTMLRNYVQGVYLIGAGYAL